MTNAEIIRTYVNSIWNQGNIEDAYQFLAEKCWRHDTDHGVNEALVCFSMEDQMERLSHAKRAAGGHVDFQILELIEAGEFVTMIWDLVYVPVSDDEQPRMLELGYYFDDQGRMLGKGIEVFRLVDEKIVEIWVAQGPWIRGHWGETMVKPLRPGELDGSALAPADVVRDYVTRMWNKRDPSAIDDYLNDPCWRHDAGEPERQFMKFDHEFQRVRAQEGYASGIFDFQMAELIESGEMVTMVWDCDYTPTDEKTRKHLENSGAPFNDKGAMMSKGIEVFRIQNGKIMEIWVAQCREFMGHWGPTMSR